MTTTTHARAQARAAAFVSANERSPVVIGRAIEPNPTKKSKGAEYTLRNGERWTLGRAACAALPEGYPKWDIGT